jgi:hypothetical protein
MPMARMAMVSMLALGCSQKDAESAAKATRRKLCSKAVLASKTARRLLPNDGRQTERFRRGGLAARQSMVSRVERVTGVRNSIVSRHA